MLIKVQPTAGAVNERAIAHDGPVVIDVSMVNVPTPTTGHWNVLDISPGTTVEHVATQ